MPEPGTASHPSPDAPGLRARAGPVLAFDTSTEVLAVALQAHGQSWHLHDEGGARASARLLPQVHALLAQAGLGLAEIGHIAFGRGPGAFTGLRTACAVAQGLGMGLDRPVLAIDSLLIVAEDARAQLQPVAAAAVLDVAVAMDARMNEVYAGVYRWQAGRWQALQAPALLALEALSAAWSVLPLQVLAGSALAVFGGRVAGPPAALRCPREHARAAALLRLAVQAAADGEGMDAAAALPLYLRDKVASTTLEREQARVAAAAAAAGDAAAPTVVAQP